MLHGGVHGGVHGDVARELVWASDKYPTGTIRGLSLFMYGRPSSTKGTAAISAQAFFDRDPPPFVIY